jgi:hypothetical protein
MLVQESFEVARPPVEVFEYVAAGFFEHHPLWDHYLVELRQHSPGPVTVGITGTEVRRFMGQQSSDFEITEFDVPRRFSLTNTSGPFALDRTYTFEPSGQGTRVQFDFDMEPRQLPVRLLFPLIRRTIAAQVTTNIGNLERLLAEPGEPRD